MEFKVRTSVMVNFQSHVHVFDYVPRLLLVYHEVTTLQRSSPLWMFRKHCKQWLNDVATLKHLLNRKIECFHDTHRICPCMLTNVTATLLAAGP